MSKIYPVKPFLLLFYGFPGAGKTYFARQICETIQSAHLQSDKVRAELFEKPQYDKQENAVVNQLMDYMTEEFLSAGLSVAYDANAIKGSNRRHLIGLARKYKAVPLIIWFQMDADTAFARNQKRDRRRIDDKYAAQLDRTTFEEVLAQMQNPRTSENYVVVSGKHLFNMQRSAVLNKLRALGSLSQNDTNSQVVKPGMVNLVPNQGRVDMTRRNIKIR